MSLRDYYIEKSIGESGPIKGPDSWAIDYVNIGRARSILEAFDDDASGFVTVGEVNSLTRLRPRDWRYASPYWVYRVSVYPYRSLPHWIAYWAIGNCTRKFGVKGLTVSRLANDLHGLLREDRRDLRCHDPFGVRSPA